ncbi:unnamed protein product [Orchesella dallaii]|uniref:Uncharacterized protein n=1 Tax=Orchesella dallaii TaxID=48710 RepID=A0ABP1PLZ9_9HEXA
MALLNLILPLVVLIAENKISGSILSENNVTVNTSIINCLIHTIYGDTLKFPTEKITRDSLLYTLFDKTTLLSYTFHKTSQFNLLPISNYSDYSNDDFDPEDIKVDSQKGFLRFNFKLSSACTVFIIKTQTYNETLQAIQSSGYGTSEEVMFLIETLSFTEENKLINGFIEDLFQSEGPPFHAPIAFLNPFIKEIVTFCYFCPTDSDFGKLIPLPPETFGLLNLLRSQHVLLNSNGYGNLVLIPDNFAYSTEESPNCFKHYDRQRSRTSLFGDHVNCNVSYLWGLASIQSVLNISFRYGGSEIDQENGNQKWMLQINVGEGMSQFIPNVYMFTRGSIQFGENLEIDSLACMDINQLQAFDFSVISALDFPTWCNIILPIFLYGFIFMKIWKGFDLVWTFFGKPLTKQHARGCVFIVLAAFSFLSMTYQSTLSAESMKLTEFPAIKKLVKDGYRFWVVEKALVVSIMGSLSNSTKNGMKKYFGMNPADPDIAFAGKGEQNIAFHYNNTLSLFLAAAKYKLFVTSISYFSMLKAFGKQLFFVNENLLCKVDGMASTFEVAYGRTIRTWAYLSNRFSKVVAILFSSGDYERTMRLNNVLSKIELKKVQITKAGTFMESKPIGLTSVVGVCCWINFAVGGLALFWWCMKMSTMWRKKIIRQRFRSNSVINVRSNE